MHILHKVYRYINNNNFQCIFPVDTKWYLYPMTNKVKEDDVDGADDDEKEDELMKSQSQMDDVAGKNL